MSAASRADAGFTLVEALVSLFVFAMIAAGAVTMLAQSVTTHSRVGQAQASLREVQNARAMLIGDLSQYVPREIASSSGVRPRLIGGDADLPLAFVRAAVGYGDGAAATRLTAVEYVIEGGALVRRTRAVAEDLRLTSSRIVLNDGISARFEFFDGATWREQWLVGAQAGEPPRAVALVFTSRRYGEVRIEALVGLGA